MEFIQHIEERVKPILALRNISPVRFKFSCLREFLGHYHIQLFTKDPNFEKFVICRGSEYELISKLKNGKHYKLGVLDGNIKEIPEWCGEKVTIAAKGLQL